MAVEPQEAKIGARKIKVLAKRKKIDWANMKKREGNWGEEGLPPFLLFPAIISRAFHFRVFPSIWVDSESLEQATKKITRE